jgi:tetratricopeptide (TPR) repeat protein
VAAGAAAYSGSLGGPFVFDDLPQIVRDPEIRELWPGLMRFLQRQRTLTTFSFALNHALGDLDPWGYHLLNLVVHVLAGLTLFGVVRRTLGLANTPERQRTAAGGLALSVALLWLLHPLQTQSVTYVVQRAESLMGLFYLLTLYCTIRAATDAGTGPWKSLAVLACALGMASKPVMLTAPVVVLLYDRIFLARSWQDLARRRAPLYVGLAFTWLVLGLTGLHTMLVERGAGEDPTIGFGMADVTAREYLLTQPEVVLHYLRLAFWPHPLVIDYGWPLNDSLARALFPGLVLAVGLAACVYALARGARAGFLGLWFFAILAPTSSLVPLRDAAFEQRMYLSLAGVSCGLVLLGHALLARWPSVRGRAVAPGVVLVVAVALGARTIVRNQDYRDEAGLWRSTIRHAPDNGRAHTSLAAALDRTGQREQTIEVLREAVQRLETLPPSKANRVYLATAHNHWGNLLRSRGAHDEAIAHYEQSAQAWTMAETHNNWGSALRSLGRYQAALDRYAEALRLAPTSVETQNNLAWLLATCPEASFRDGPRALEVAQTAARATGHEVPALLDTLAAAFAETRAFEQAVEWQRRAIERASAAEKPAYTARLALYLRGEPFRDGS